MVQQHQPNPTQQRLGLAALVAAFAALIALGISAERRIDVAEVARETPRPDDVLLASFPKSGSHWARFLILRLLDENLDALTFAEAERRMPDLELGPARQAFNRGPPAVRHRRVFKSHQPWRAGAIGTAEHRSVGGEPCAAELKNMDWSQCLCPNCPQRWRRIIYMVRDPRAVLCSFYKFQTQLGNIVNTSSYADFLRMDESRYGFDWPRHVDSYLNATSDVFFLKYEDLHSKPEATLSELATWLGVEVTQERLADVIRLSDRKAMQRAEAATGTPLFDQLYPDARRNGFRLVREGSTTAWRDECGEVDFDALLPGWREAMGRLGYAL